MVSTSLTEKRHLNPKERPEVGNDVSSVKIQGKNVPGKGKSRAKKPRGEIIHSRNNKGIHVAKIK